MAPKTLVSVSFKKKGVIASEGGREEGRGAGTH